MSPGVQFSARGVIGVLGSERRGVQICIRDISSLMTD